MAILYCRKGGALTYEKEKKRLERDDYQSLLCRISSCILGILCMRGYAKDVSIGAMHKEFESAKLLDGMDEGKDKDLRRYFGIDGKECDGYFYYKAESPMAWMSSLF